MSDDGNPMEWIGSWVTTSTADDGSGIVQLEDAEGDEATQMGLPGHYSRGVSGVRGFKLQLENGGGVIVATYTAPPSDCMEGEVGIVVGDTSIRLRPSGTGAIAEMKSGAGATNIRIYPDGTVRIANATTIELGGATTVVLNGDNVLSAALLQNHTHGGVVPPDPTLAIGAVVGTASSSATLTKGG